MDYIAFVHPTNYLRLVEISARERWKREQHDIRYTRRYGRPPTIYKGELGTVDGFRIIPTAAA